MSSEYNLGDRQRDTQEKCRQTTAGTLEQLLARNAHGSDSRLAAAGLKIKVLQSLL